jgi:hypothetical protein
MFASMVFFIQDLASILPMPDAIVVLRITGTSIKLFHIQRLHTREEHGES